MAERQSTSATARYGLAQAYLRLGRFAESAAAARAALQIDPLNQKSRYLLATALIRAGLKEQGRKVLDDYERREAASEAEKKRRLDIDEVDRTASAAMMAGHREEAIRLLRDGIRAHPGAAVLYLKLGLAQS